MVFNAIVKLDETGYYVAEVPALPGCISQGKTIKEVKENIKEAIEGWLEVMNANEVCFDRLYQFCFGVC